MDQFIFYDSPDGKQKTPTNEMIADYLKAVETYKDILKDKIKEIEYKKDNEED